jgi:hypothetical protein
MSQLSLFSFSLVLSLITLLFNGANARANCADQIASLELVKPVMERQWQKLQQQTNYPWGKARPYGTLSGNLITLTSEFERLTGQQKQQVLDQLLLGYNHNWFELLTPQEQEKLFSNPEMGALSPYQVYSADGRIISTPYDGCTRFTLLTEKDRFSWYFNTTYSYELKDSIRSQMLRNTGKPPWREVKFPMTIPQERAVRLQFWRIIGYDKVEKGWWIAWVPETGYFEINVPVNYDKKRLQRYWEVAPKKYRYQVINNEGTLLENKGV